jgi:type II secretory pathway component PulF
MLEAQSSGPLKHVLEVIGERISEGKELARALETFPKSFSPFAIGVVRIGEVSGTLPYTLRHLAVELERRDVLYRKLAGSLLYPALIAVATISITGFLLMYLFPRIMPIFVSLRIPLPFTTRIVLSLSSFLIHYGWLVLLFVLVATGIGLYVYPRHAQLRMRTHRFLLLAPVLGTLIRSYENATALRTIALLLSTGTTLDRALALLSETISHPLYRAAYQDLAARVERGGSIREGFSAHPTLFPVLIPQMATVGERTGSLDTSLEELAKLYETELDELSRTLALLVEPALMIVMGFVIGFIAVSIIAPVYGITQHLHA